MISYKNNKIRLFEKNIQENQVEEQFSLNFKTKNCSSCGSPLEYMKMEMEFGSCQNCGKEINSLDFTIGGFLAGILTGGLIVYGFFKKLI